jgi:type IV pilus assembly protein PilC
VIGKLVVQYRYTGRSVDGELITGNVWGEDEISALKSISGRGVSVISINLLEKKKKKVWKNLEVSYLFQQVHILLKSGYTIVHAIQLLQKKNKNKQMKLILQQISSDLVSGNTFYDALKKVEMNDMVLQWIYIAENSGELEEPCLEISKYYKTKNDLLKKIVKVLAYPIFMFLLSIMLFIFCTVVFIPKFFPLYEGFGLEPPFFIIALASIGMFLQIYGLYILLFLLVGLLLALFLRRRYQEKLMVLINKIPLLMKMKHANVFLLLSIMINSGISVYEAVRLMRKGTSNKQDEKLFIDWLEKIKQGTSLSALFELSSFDPMYIHMVKIGESSGRLGEMLSKSSEHAEEVVKESIDRTIAIIQPVLILILGIIVGIMVYTIMMPVSAVLKTV